ncbi:MAG: DUF4422 domain-containing protein [bacterium]|nr:DUF4422 domain-containing protein [bacterium]
MEKVKILVTYNKKHDILKSDIFTPIQTGRAIATEVFDEMIGDDTGDNISEKNWNYSELSALYWAWKNYDKLGCPEYIGHVQYRRHFILKEQNIYAGTTEDAQFGYSVKFLNNMTEDYINTIGLDNNTVNETLKNNDIIVVKKGDMSYIACKNAKEDYLKHVPCSRYTDYELLIDTVNKKYPEYKDAVREFENGPYRYFYHMFMMKKDIFFEYMDFVFNVLFDIESKIDYSDRGSRGLRVMGYLGEMLLSIFIFNKYKQNFKIKEVYSTYVYNTSYDELKTPEQEVLAYYLDSRDKIDNAILSIKSYMENYNCDKPVFIFYKNIDINELIKIENKLDYKLDIKFYNLKRDVDTPKEYRICSMLHILYLLRNKSNVLYIDGYCIFNKKYSIDVDCKKVLRAFKYTNIYSKINKSPDAKEYYEKLLNLKNPYDYFTDAFLYFNCKNINFDNVLNKISKMPKEITSQCDILNYIFNDDVEFLNPKDIFFCGYYTKLKYFKEEEYATDMKNSSIVYRSNCLSPENEFAESLYNKFLPEVNLSKRCHIYTDNKLREIVRYKKEVLLHFMYKFLYNFVFGKTKGRYIRKIRELKNKNDVTKRFLDKQEDEIL